MPFINKMTKQTSNAKAYMYKMIYKKISVHCDKKLRVFHAPENQQMNLIFLLDSCKLLSIPSYIWSIKMYR